jgi:hypothetical protein
LAFQLGFHLKLKAVVGIFEGRLVGENGESTVGVVDGTHIWPGGPGLRALVRLLDGAKFGVMPAGPGLLGLEGEADGA